MNLEKVRYFLLISNKMNDEAFMVVSSVFSSRRKRISSKFSSFGRSCPLKNCYLHLGGVCLLEDCYLSGFYPFVG